MRVATDDVDTNVHYPFPPITEAVVEFVFENEVEYKVREKLSAKLAARYPNESIEIGRSIEIAIDEGGKLDPEAVKLEEDDRLIRRSNHDENEVLIIAKNRMVVSRFPVYDGWESLIKRTKKDWETAKSIWGFRKISRIGVRFINRIDLPFEDGEILPSRYFNIYFTFPPEFGPMVASGWRSEHAVKDLEAILILTVARVESPLPKHMALALDIDLVKTLDPPQKDDNIFSYLEQARIFKNMVFEKSITEETRKKFTDDLRVGSQ